MLDKPLWENVGQIRSVGLAADGPFVRSGVLRRRARAQVRALRIRSRSVDQPAGSLSGGNQQKVVFAKWLDAAPSVVLLDDPTRGVDVGAKAEMHALIRSTAEAGAPVLICSTDIDELASLCDRVVVLHQGRVSAVLAGGALRTHAVLEAMNQGSNVRVLSDDDLEQQRARPVLQVGQDVVERREQVVVGLDPARLAALRAGHRRDVDPVQRRPRAVAAGALGEPVHDRVAAVAQDDEQHAGVVGGRAPERLDLVEARAVADDGQHRAVRARHPQADRRRQREAEHPHRAEEPQRRGRGDARVQLRAAARGLLQQHRVAREPLRQRLQDVAGHQRLARPRRLQGSRTGVRRGGGLARADGLRERLADRGAARPARRARPGCGAPPRGPA